MQPSTGYIYPREALEVAITLLEGVDSRTDRFLIMVAEVDNDKEEVDRMSNAELVRLWRNRNRGWSHVYQEKYVYTLIVTIKH